MNRRIVSALVVAASLAGAGCGQAGKPVQTAPAPSYQPAAPAPAYQPAPPAPRDSSAAQPASAGGAPSSGSAANVAAKPSAVPSTSRDGGATEQTIQVVMKEFKFEPDTITVTAGTRVRLALKNEGQRKHDFKVENAFGEPKADVVEPGQTGTLEFVADRAGEYVVFCTLRGHRDRGMHGKLIVK